MSFSQDTTKVIDFFKNEVASLRTGRANAAIVEGVKVDAYGTLQPIRQIAGINVPDATTIVITPWDKGLLGAIETSLKELELGTQPVNDGNVIRVVLPPMTEERRAELTKVVGEKLEAARVALRNLRHDAIAEADKEDLSEDQLKHRKDELTKETTRINDDLERLATEKKQEIMTL